MLAPFWKLSYQIEQIDRRFTNQKKRNHGWNTTIVNCGIKAELAWVGKIVCGFFNERLHEDFALSDHYGDR